MAVGYGLTGRLRRWHHTLGAAVAWLFVLVALTGALLVYRDAIIRHTVAAGVEAVPLDAALQQSARIAANLDGIVDRYSSSGIGHLKTPGTERPYWTVVDTEGRSRLLAPGSLQQLNAYPWLLDLLDITRRIHTGLILALPGEVVLFLLGLAVLFFSFSGALMWWPSRRHFRPGALLPSRWSRQQLLLSHRQFGVLLLPLLLLVTLSGTIMVGNKLVNIIGTAQPQTAAESATCQVSSELSTGQLYLRAVEEIPQGRITLVSLPDCRARVAVFRVRLPGEWHPNGRIRIPLDADSGRVGDYAPAASSGWWQQLLKPMYPLHSSYGLPGLYAAVVLFTGLGSAWLGISGFSGWLSRRRARRC